MGCAVLKLQALKKTEGTSSLHMLQTPGAGHCGGTDHTALKGLRRLFQKPSLDISM